MWKTLFPSHMGWFLSSERLKSHFMMCCLTLGGLEVHLITFRWVFWWLKNNCTNYSIGRFRYMWKTPYFHSMLTNFDYLKGYNQLESNFLMCWIILGGLEAHWVTFRWVFWLLKNKCPNYSIVRFHYMWKTSYFHSLLTNLDYLKG